MSTKWIPSSLIMKLLCHCYRILTQSLSRSDSSEDHCVYICTLHLMTRMLQMYMFTWKTKLTTSQLINKYILQFTCIRWNKYNEQHNKYDSILLYYSCMYNLYILCMMSNIISLPAVDETCHPVQTPIDLPWCSGCNVILILYSVRQGDVANVYILWNEMVVMRLIPW